MPKSRFNARHHARSARHNPLASGSSKPGKGAAVSGSGHALGGAAQDAASRDVIPLLFKLPFAGEKRSTPQPPTPPGTDADSEFIWALSSVSALLCSRPSRKILLAPNHRLVARLVNAIKLSSISTAAASTSLEMRKEAAGALRNLCVEGLGHGAGAVSSSSVAKDQRRLADSLVSEGAIEVAVEQLLWAATSLSGPGREEETQPAAEAAAEPPPASINKPLDQMNRKERRQAAKLGVVTTNGASLATTTSGVTSAMDPDDAEQLLALYALAENAVTILWCLCEASSSLLTTTALNVSAVQIAQVLCQAVSGTFLSAQASDTTGSLSTTAAARQRDLLSAARQLALQSANALCALTDDNVPFCIALCGVEDANISLQLDDEDEGAASGAKGKHRAKAPRKNKSALGREVFDVLPDAETGKQNLASLLAGIAALRTPSHEHEALVLGVACASVVRNVLASLPRVVRAGIKVPVGGETVKLEVYERTHTLPALLNLLEGTALLPTSEQSIHGPSALNRLTQLAGDALTVPKTAAGGSAPDRTPEEVVAALNAAPLNGEEQAEEDADAPRSNTARRAEEALQAVQLALEVLAEILPTLPTTSVDARPGSGEEESKEADVMEQDGEDEWEEDVEDVEGKDADMDATMDEDEDEIPIDDDEGGVEHDTEKTLGGSAGTSALAKGFTAGALAQSVSSGKLLSRLLQLGNSTALAEQFPHQGAQEVQLARGRAARSLALRALAALSNLLLALASHAPPPPSRAAPAGSPEAARTAVVRGWLAADTEAGQALRTTWTECFALAGQCAALPIVVQETAAEVQPSVKEQAADARAIIETCVGSMWSIARLLEGDLPILLSVPGTEQQLDILSALRAAYMTAHTDGMRVKCLGTLGCLARSATQAHGGFGSNAVVGHFLIEILEALPPVNSKHAPIANGDQVTSTTTADAMTATLDALFDIYADEEAVWDKPVFRADGFKDRLRNVLPRAQAVVKRIDKRVNRSLWSSAGTAVGNLSDFVKYRDGLGF